MGGERSEARVAARGRGARVMGFIHDDEVEGTGWRRIATERRVGHDVRESARGVQRALPHVAQRCRGHDERTPCLAQKRGRHERLAQPDVIGEQRTAVAMQEVSQAGDGALLMRPERDGAGAHGGVLLAQDAPCDPGARCRDRDDQRLHQVSSGSARASGTR